ncbi:MAG: quinone-dependent dihydroorotate dehydrogenase [Cyclobacteriaceae bacterium]
MYKLFKPILFLLSPEQAHHFTTRMLRLALRIPFVRGLINLSFNYEHPKLKKELFGLEFKNPVGLAAGFDKNAELIDDFTNLGFGFIEIGTLTPKAQPGNDQPRLFRLKSDKALINRMGFNNHGVEEAVVKLKSRKSNVIVGGNIGKNKVTPNEEAVDDYLKCFHMLHDYVDYFVVNVSSPNTPGLRELQEKEPLKRLLRILLDESKAKGSKKSILLKIAPDLSEPQLDDILEITAELNLDGLIISNTTVDRGGLRTSDSKLEAIGPGGLSGAPVLDKSNQVLKYIRKANSDVPIIAVGGIMSAEDALAKIEAGANLVQIYTGLIYEGPGLVKRINKALARRLN